MHALHQVVGEFRRTSLRLLGDALRLACYGAARPEREEPRAGRRDDEPPRLETAAVPIAASLRRVRDVCESFRQIDQTL